MVPLSLYVFRRGQYHFPSTSSGRDGTTFSLCLQEGTVPLSLNVFRKGLYLFPSTSSGRDGTTLPQRLQEGMVPLSLNVFRKGALSFYSYSYEWYHLSSTYLLPKEIEVVPPFIYKVRMVSHSSHNYKVGVVPYLFHH
ncbi:hypothetical protein J6590_070467 [Homalodisca vitripennis]|nr:hypothetical protein J6590_070467 [Homalodisca vitripennis]